MKKTLVAVAAMAAIAGAHAEATISGTLAFGMDQVTNTTSGAAVTTKYFGDQRANSALKVDANEDLGSGLKADIHIEVLPSLGYNQNITSYQSYVGLGGDFGRVQGGAFISPAFAVAAAYDATGAWGLNPAVQPSSNAGLFVGNQVKYSLPNFVHGLSASASKVMGETTGNRAGEQTSYSVGYAASGFTGDYAYTTITPTGLGASTKISNMGLGYDFGAAKLVALVVTQKNGSNAVNNGSSYGVIVPVGAISLKAQYGTTNGYQSSSTSTTTAVKQTGTDYAVSYAFSKRTSLNAVMSTRSGYNGSTAVNGDSVKQNQVFVMHSF